jgi:hypothetical protein
MRTTCAGFFRGRFQSRQSLLVSGKFPVPEIREHAGRNPEKRPNHGSSLAGVSQFRCISLYLPSKSGICAQRRVRYRLHAPPSSLRFQRLVDPSAKRRGSSRDSAGFWARAWEWFKRRRPGGAADGETVVLFLRGQLRRFGLGVGAAPPSRDFRHLPRTGTRSTGVADGPGLQEGGAIAW